MHFEFLLRILALLVSIGLVAVFGPPDAGVLFQSRSLDELRAALEWPARPGPFLELRGAVILDFLLLLAHGFLFRFLFRSYGTPRFAGLSTSLMMTFDIAENVSILLLLEQVAQGSGAYTAVHFCYIAFSVLKWIFVAATYWLASGVHWFFRVAALSALGILAALLVHPAAISCVSLPLGVSLAIAILARAIRDIKILDASFILYALRVPLLACAACAAYPMLALGPIRSFVEATLYFYDGWASVLLASFLGFLFAQAIGIQASTTLHLGPARFGLPFVPDAELRPVLAFLLNSSNASMALTLVTSAVFSHGVVNPFILAVLLGFVAAYALVAGTDLLNAYLTDKTAGEAPMLFLILPDGLAERWRAFVEPILERRQPVWFAEMKAKLTVGRTIPGYLKNGVICAEHVFSLIFLGAAGVFYILILIWVFYCQMAPPLTIASFSLLGLVLLSVVNGLAFFGDRYRLPVIVLLILTRVVAGFGHETDYVFRTVRSIEQAPRKTPGEVLRSFGARPILVAASGGGIQASAWMTTVLANLNEDPKLDLRSRLALISSVSGGSVGAYHLGKSWNDWSRAATASRKSSLGQISVALAGPDFFHPAVTLFGFPYVDRGYGLESAIQIAAGETEKPDTIDDWAKRAGSQFPAVLFNTTSAETGAPVAITTSLLPSDAYRKVTNPLTGKHVVWSWDDFIKESGESLAERNLTVATAARLSATFPYVSPSARPISDGKKPFRYHFVDGGYYDNYGLVALTQWLDDALESGVRPEKVTILVIRGQEPRTFTGSKSQPGTAQFSAPVGAFLAMREYAQWHGIDAAIRLFCMRWTGKVLIETIVISFPAGGFANPICSEPPLSWKLTPLQQECLDQGWKLAKERLDRGPNKLNPTE